jgi:hypothetical protein
MEAWAKNNKAALAEVNRLVVERNALLMGSSTAHAEAFTDYMTNLRTTPGPFKT